MYEIEEGGWLNSFCVKTLNSRKGTSRCICVYPQRRSLVVGCKPEDGGLWVCIRLQKEAGSDVMMILCGFAWIGMDLTLLSYLPQKLRRLSAIVSSILCVPHEQ